MKKYLLLALLLSGCATQGLSPTQADFNGTNIVVVRDDHPLFHNGTFWVEIDGKQVCDIHAPNFMIYHTTPGDHIIQSSLFGEIGTSTIRINVKANHSVYVHMKYKGAFASASFIGGAIGETALNESGPVAFSIGSSHIGSEYTEDCQ